PMVVERVTQLIKELADAKHVYEYLDVISEKKKAHAIKISAKAVNSFLGTNIKDVEIKNILTSLGFKIAPDKGGMKVTPPSARGDITMSADLYEEIARIYGYDKIPAELPEVVLSPEFKFMEKSELLKISIRNSMQGLGYLETLSYSFVPENYHSLLGLGDKDVLKLKNPISETMKVMRVSLVPSLIESVKYNLNHRNLDLKIFEIGNVYKPGKGGTDRPKPTDTVAVERETMVCVFTGNVIDAEDWTRNKDDGQSYYIIKGEIKALLDQLRIPNVDFIPLDSVQDHDVPKYLHPGSSSAIKCCGKISGFVGKIHPEFALAFELEDIDVYVSELFLDIIKDYYDTNMYFKELPKFPSIRRDVSFLIDEKVSYSEISSYIRKLKTPNLKSYNVFDLYKGKGIPDGKKSMAWSFVFAADDRTLVDSEADSAIKTVIEGIKREFSVEIR
ncbi:MAG: phenylalanine--tRNA ligase subunit beta, partial [Pseudomonadota bacterium]